MRRDQSGKVLALAHVHVDDFLVVYDPQNVEATQCFKTLCGLYEWGLWESADFVQCGVRIRQSVDRHGRWGAIRADMAHYAEELEAVPIPPMRRKRPDLPLTKAEVAEFRGLCGQLMWLAVQAVPPVMAPLSLLLGYSANPTVDTLLRANRLLRETKVEARIPLAMHPLKNPCVLAWTNAAGAVRKDCRSQGEHLLALVDGDALLNREFRTNVVTLESSQQVAFL